MRKCSTENLQLCSLAGAETLDLGITRDTVGDVEACFARAIEQGADVLITSGTPLLLEWLGVPQVSNNLAYRKRCGLHQPLMRMLILL